jgi:RHS repeat-associated protein
VRFNPASTECTTVTWLLRGLGVAPGIGNIVAQQRYTINFGGATSQPVTHYCHPNHRGDTAYLTDASGVKAASYVYDAFGRLLTDNGSPITVYRFSGKEGDPDAQLYYFGFRWYDPDTGTWTTKDPRGLLFSYNTFKYAGNAPVCLIDSYGLRGVPTAPNPGLNVITEPALLKNTQSLIELAENAQSFMDGLAALNDLAPRPPLKTLQEIEREQREASARWYEITNALPSMMIVICGGSPGQLPIWPIPTNGVLMPAYPAAHDAPL